MTECDKSDELKRICHEMAYGDDSDKTFDRYCYLLGLDLTDQEKKEKKQEIFGE